MRLHELKKPKEIDLLRSYHQNAMIDNWRDYANELLGPHGFKSVGVGYYGTVYVHPTYPFALKVFRKDSGFTEWFRFAKQNQSNPFVPKLKGQLVTILKGYIYAVRMEKLERPPNKFGRVDQNQLNEQSILFMKYFNYFNKRGLPKDLPIIGDENIDSIFQIFSDNKDKLDLGPNNIMVRGDQIVVTDPLAGDD